MLKHLFISASIILSALLSASAISIGEIGFFGDVTGSAASNWPHFITLASSDEPNSGGVQTLNIRVTSLPAGGANYRVVRTVGTGQWDTGDSKELKIGSNLITVPEGAFSRVVKIQFSSGDVEYDSLIVNGTALSLDTSKPSISLSEAIWFTDSGNDDWPKFSTLTISAEGSYSQREQRLEIYVTSLPPGGANLRVFKTTATGKDYFGDPQQIKLGPNTVTVSSVSFDRTVKIQFSSSDLDFNDLAVNGSVLYDGSVRDTLPPVITLNGDSSITLTVGDTYQELGASSTDSTDGTVEVIISGEVNTSSIGTYTITYAATDAAGNSASVNRTVTVEEADADGDGFADNIDVHPGFDDGKLTTYLTTWLTENNYVSTSAIEDLRAGSTSVAVSGGIATINLEIEQSDDLKAWNPTGESATVNVTVSEDTRFYRIKLAD